MTHKEHLKKWGFDPKGTSTEEDYNSDQTEARWQELIARYGEDNVWDYRILDKAFETNNCNFTLGMMFDAVKRETGEKGSLNQDGTILGQPRFYFDFR